MIYVEIILRVIFALCAIGCIVGLTFWEKNKIFEGIAKHTAFIVFMYGLVRIIVYAILGLW